MSGHRSSQDWSERRVSGWTHISSFEGIDPQKIDRTQWRDYEIPKELEMVQAGTPLEIYRIITASLDKHRSTEVALLDRDISPNLGNDTVTESVRRGLDTKSNVATSSYGSSTRPTSGASDASLASYGTAGEGILARSSVTSVSSVGWIPDLSPQTILAQRPPGLPKMATGALGWVNTYEEGEKRPSWWRRRKGPKKPKAAITHDKVNPSQPSNGG